MGKSVTRNSYPATRTLQPVSCNPIYLVEIPPFYIPRLLSLHKSTFIQMTENRQLPKWGRQIANLLFQLSTIFGLLEGLQIKDYKIFFYWVILMVYPSTSITSPARSLARLRNSGSPLR